MLALGEVRCQPMDRDCGCSRTKTLLSGRWQAVEEVLTATCTLLRRRAGPLKHNQASSLVLYRSTALPTLLCGKKRNMRCEWYTTPTDIAGSSHRMTQATTQRYSSPKTERKAVLKPTQSRGTELKEWRFSSIAAGHR